MRGTSSAGGTGGGAAATGGGVESLWGRIKQAEMGSRVERDRPAIGALPTQKESTVGGTAGARAAAPLRRKKTLLETAGELTGSRYRPHTKETSLAWEFLLAFVANKIGAEERDVLAAAAEECLVILKDESVEGRELERKTRLEAVLQLSITLDDLAQMVNLAKRITDYVSPTKGPSASTIYQPEDQAADAAVAVVFEEEEEEEEEEEDEEEDGTNAGFDGVGAEDTMFAPVPIPILRESPMAPLEEEQEQATRYGDLSMAPLAMAESQPELQDLDLESLAFPQGKICQCALLTPCPNNYVPAPRRPHHDQQKVHRSPHLEKDYQGWV